MFKYFCYNFSFPCLSFPIKYIFNFKFSSYSYNCFVGYDMESFLTDSNIRIRRKRKYPRYERNQDGRLPCPRCREATYQRRTALIRHLEYECGIEPKFECGCCGRKFKQKTHLKSHLNNIHGIL